MDGRADLLHAFAMARDAGEVAAMTEAALALAADHPFGVHVGSIPAHLHEAYTAATGRDRVRLAIALARIWGYGNEAERGAPFAAEAVAGASELDDPALLADALDAQLLARWGPDELADRVAITARLSDVVAHVPTVEPRLSAHLWRLTTALETLDAPVLLRQLRALDELAAESQSPRVRLFADSRRAMYALITGDLDTAERLRASAVAAGERAGAADTMAIAHELAGWIARQRGDQAAMIAEAATYEEYGTAEGIPSIVADGASLWLAAGKPERARSLLDQVAGADFGHIPRDVDWLLTVGTLTEVAAATGAHELTLAGARQLERYPLRAIVNSGGVVFGGVVDDVLRQAASALGRDEVARRWAASAAAAYHRIGARWWLQRLALPGAGVAYLVPGTDGVWTVGTAEATAPIREVKGLRYLRLLLERPGTQIAALSLSAAVAGHGEVDEAGLEVLDRQALAAYRRRLADLDGVSDPAAVAEREALLAEVAAATGLAGRQRSTGSSAERARVAVQKSVAAAIKRIGEVDPALGRLLQDTVRTGTSCGYDPDPARPIRWVLSR